MTIQWKQTGWYPRNHKTAPSKAYRWEGLRSDGRTFAVLYIEHLARSTGKPYLATSFNGTQVGAGKSLAEAQAACMAVAQVRLPVRVAK